MPTYSPYFLCNECSEVHPMGLVLPLEDGPVNGASIEATYAGKALPAILANIGANTVTCPKTAKLTSQRDNDKVFLIHNRLTADAEEKLP